MGQEGSLNVFVEEPLEVPPVPASIRLFPFDNESRILADPVTDGLVEAEKGLDVDDSDLKAMFVKGIQFTHPLGEAKVFFFQIGRVLFQLTGVEPLVEAGLVEEDLTVPAMVEVSDHFGHDFQENGSHPKPPLFRLT
jgi:hypothetical protein